MPNPVNNMIGEYWIECSLCGFLYPRSKMRRQRGFWVCTVIPCFDEPNRQFYEEQLQLPEEESAPLVIPDEPYPETAP